jgi:hypothetical protein
LSSLWLHDNDAVGHQNLPWISHLPLLHVRRKFNERTAYPMRGFGSFESASRFCSAFDEHRDYFRCRTQPKPKRSLAEQRRIFRQRFGVLQYMLTTA